MSWWWITLAQADAQRMIAQSSSDEVPHVTRALNASRQRSLVAHTSLHHHAEPLYWCAKFLLRRPISTVFSHVDKIETACSTMCQKLLNRCSSCVMVPFALCCWATANLLRTTWQPHPIMIPISMPRTTRSQEFF